jgi:pimeloyl-ACP methyl ester carboxylesterase
MSPLRPLRIVVFGGLFFVLMLWPAAAQVGTVTPTAEAWPPTERTVDLNGLETRVITAGPADAAETVVLVHGGPGVSSDVLHGLFALAGPDLRVVAYDQRGTGGTAQPADGDLSLPALTADLDALRETLGIAQMHLLGHSWGGLLAAAYTAAYPERVISLTLIGPIPLAPDRASLDDGYAAFNARIGMLQEEGLMPDPLPTVTGEDCAAFVAALLPAYLTDPAITTARIRAALPHAPCNWSTNQRTSDAAWAFMQTPPYAALREAAGHWTGRLLVVFGADDPFSPWAALTAAPFTRAQQTIEIVPHAGHYPWLDDPHFLDRLRSFLLSAPSA